MQDSTALGAHNLGEAAFLDALDAAAPGWREHDRWPSAGIFASFRRSAMLSRAELIDEVVTLALGSELDATAKLDTVLFERLDRVEARAALESIIGWSLA